MKSLLLVMFSGLMFATTLLTSCSSNAGASPPGVSWPGDATMPGNELGVVVDQGMTVLAIEAGSAAEKAALKVGDGLETIEDVPFATERTKAKQLIHATQPGTQLHLRLQRAGQLLELLISPEPPAAQPNAPTPTAVPPTQDYF